MSITPRLDTHSPAPWGPEVTEKRSAARYFQPPPGAAARPGHCLPPPPVRPSPPSQGELRGGGAPVPPLPQSLLWSRGGLETKLWLLHTPNDSDQGYSQGLNRGSALRLSSPLVPRPNLACLGRSWRWGELLNLCRPQSLARPGVLKCSRLAPSHLLALHRGPEGGLLMGVLFYLIFLLLVGWFVCFLRNKIIKIKFSPCLELGRACPACSSRGTYVQLGFLDKKLKYWSLKESKYV